MSDYAKQTVNSAKNAIKNGIENKLKPILIKYGAPVAAIIIIFTGIMGAFMDEDEAEAATGMNKATGNQWKFFIENYLKSWEGHEGISEDGTKYRVGLVKGNRTVGYGIDLETSGLDDDIKALGYDTSENSYIPIDVIDQFTYQEIQDWYNSVKNSMASNGVSPKEYQLYALTDFAYNCGSVNSFYEGKSMGQAFKEYYDTNIDDKYGDWKNVDFLEKISAKILQYNKDGEGNILTYNDRRRHSEACLFQTGYYGYDIKRTDISTDKRGVDAYYREYADGGEIQEYLDRVIDEEITCDVHGKSLAPDTTYNHYGYQCKGYAMCLFYKCFKITPGITYDKPNNYKLSLVSGMELVGSEKVKGDASKAQELFGNARPGDFIQIRRQHSGSHSAIVYSVDSDGTTWLENNIDGKCGTFLKTYTWAQLAQSNEYMSIYTATDYSLAN